MVETDLDPSLCWIKGTCQLNMIITQYMTILLSVYRQITGGNFLCLWTPTYLERFISPAANPKGKLNLFLLKHFCEVIDFIVQSLTHFFFIKQCFSFPSSFPSLQWILGVRILECSWVSYFCFVLQQEIPYHSLLV